jgi:hypothetical protein
MADQTGLFEHARADYVYCTAILAVLHLIIGSLFNFMVI